MKPKKAVPLKQAFKEAGLKSGSSVNDFFARFGIANVRVGSTTLKVEPKVKKPSK